MKLEASIVMQKYYDFVKTDGLADSLALDGFNSIITSKRLLRFT